MTQADIPRMVWFVPVHSFTRMAACVRFQDLAWSRPWGGHMPHVSHFQVRAAAFSPADRVNKHISPLRYDPWSLLSRSAAARNCSVKNAQREIPNSREASY